VFYSEIQEPVEDTFSDSEMKEKSTKISFKISA